MWDIVLRVIINVGELNTDIELGDIKWLWIIAEIEYWFD